MKCPDCGNEIPSTARFCTKCGKPVSQNTDTVDAQPKESFVWKEQYTYIAIGAAIVLAAALGLAVKVFKSADSGDYAAEAVTEEEGNDASFIQEDVLEEAEDAREERDLENEDAPDIDGEEAQAADSPDDISEPAYLLPDSDVRYLDKSDLEGFSQEECRLARNELYARHGRRFDDEELQAYFNGKDWYEGTIDASDFKEDMLNDYEMHNRDLIVEYEKEMGYR